MTVYINGTTGYSGPVGTIGDLTTTGNTTLGDASGDTLTLNGNTASIPNGLNFTNGNIGLGVTPSAWSGAKAFQTGSGGVATTALWDLSNNTFLTNGAYWNGSNYIYVASSFPAARYVQTSGAHTWSTAAGGTAGNAITFTQAMTLDASGNLGLGVTPISLGAGYTNLTISNATNGGGVTFAVGNTAKASIFNAGNNLYIDRSNAAGVMYFRNTANGTTDITLDASGNWILGGTTARTRLTLQAGEANAPTLGTASGGAFFGNSSVAYGTLFGTSGSGYGWIQQQRVDGTGTAYDLCLQPSGGNLLVGTTSATYSSSGRGLIEVNGSSQSLIAFKIGGGATNSVYQYNTTTSFETNVTGSRFLNWTVNGSERARISSAGNFGIATTAPAYTLDVNGSMRCSWKISNGLGYGYGFSSTWTTIFTIPSSSDGSFWARMHAYNTENGATSHFTFYFTAVIRHNGSPYSDFYNFVSTANADLQGASGSAYAQFRFTNNGVTNGPLYFQAYNTTYYNTLYIYDIYAYGISPSWN